MKTPYIYLAGPIFGCSEGEAKDWRKYVDDAIRPHGMIGISPLRCEPCVNGQYNLTYPDPCFGQAKAILAKNFLDLRACDFTLAYFPKPKDLSAQRSAGTMGELAWTYALQKPSVVVTDDPFIEKHPFTSCQGSWPVLPNLDEAIRLLVGIYGGYTGGKNV